MSEREPLASQDDPPPQKLRKLLRGTEEVEQVVLASRRVTVVVVAVGFLAASLFMSGDAAARVVHHAGVVVQHGDLGTLTDCVAFTESKIDGMRLVEKSRFEYRSARFPEGTGICWLDGEGCKTTRSEQCFCTPAFGTTASWSYWIQEHGDQMIHHGETYPSERVIGHGSVDYWTFGPHGMPPTSLHSFEEICGEAAAATLNDDDAGAPVLLATARSWCRGVAA